jgi:hypothetical protein
MLGRALIIKGLSDLACVDYVNQNPARRNHDTTFYPVNSHLPSYLVNSPTPLGVELEPFRASSFMKVIAAQLECELYLAVRLWQKPKSRKG